MILYILPIGAILVALGGILTIVVRKLPQLAQLDLSNLPFEKEVRKKREIIGKRIEERGRVVYRFWAGRFSPVQKTWAKLQFKFRVYVGKVERLWHHEQTVKFTSDNQSLPRLEREEKLATTIREGWEALKNQELDRAEEIFISAIKLNRKSVVAYRGLADTYFAKSSWQEAKETYHFLLKLSPEDDNVMVKLAEIAEEEGDSTEAIRYYEQAVVVNDSISQRFYRLAELLTTSLQPRVALEAALQAVELESKNPKYLDLLAEIAIICGDKPTALQAYNDLRLVNPENQKLEVLKDKIKSLG